MTITNPSAGEILFTASETGATAFSALTSATNTQAAMVVGTGASLTTSGTGSIGATTLLGGATNDLIYQSGAGTTAFIAPVNSAVLITSSGGVPSESTTLPAVNGAAITGLTYTQLPSLSANQVLGAVTATTPSGLTLPSCAAAADAINYTLGTGFGCNTSITAAAVSGTVGIANGGTNATSAVAGTVPNATSGTAASWTSTPTLGASGTLGSITLGNATSGTVTIATVAGALGTVTASLPANTGTIAELNIGNTFTAAQTATAFVTSSNANNLGITATNSVVHSTSAYLQFAGSSGVGSRVNMNSQTSPTLTAGDNYASLIVGNGLVTTAATGTHSWLANVAIDPLGTVTSGGAAVTNEANLYIGSAGAAATNNYSLYVAGPTTIASTLAASTSVSSPVFLSTAAQTTVSCSTSGSAIFSEPEQGTSDKKVLIHMSSCLGTASYTYPVAFTNTPSIYASNNVAASIATSLSGTAVTVTGATTTGSLILEDY
jgi:hypothetical protein